MHQQAKGFPAPQLLLKKSVGSSESAISHYLFTYKNIMNIKYLFVAIPIVISMVSCDTHKEHKAQIATFFATSPIQKDTTITREYVCQIHSIQHIELRALEKGYLEKIFVDEGQFVKKGQLMFQIMPRLYQAELEKSEAEAHFAEIEYMNTKKLADKKIVAANELALAEAKWDKAKAELALSQVHLDFTQVRAPFDGIMDHFHVRLGSMVEEGDLLSTLSDNHSMWVYFNVPEAEYLNFKTTISKDSSLAVKLLLANNELFNQVGEVTTIEADFNNETGNIAFRATFPNPKGLLRHGETGSILMASPISNAMLIPQKATFEILDKRYVYIVSEDNTVHSEQITVTAEMPDLFVIDKGLSENDKILLEGLRKVRDGDKIAINYKEPKDVLNELQVYAE